MRYVISALVALLFATPAKAAEPWPGGGGAGGECAATLYTPLNFAVLTFQTLTSAGGQDTVDVGADSDWVEQKDTTSEFTKCTGLEDDAVVKFTRGSATAVPFMLTYSHSGRWTGGVGANGNLNIKLYKHTQAAITGGDELKDGTYVASITLSHAVVGTTEAAFHDHDAYSRTEFAPASVQILVDMDENDCVGVTMGTTVSSMSYLHLNNALTLSETGTCGAL